MLFSKMSMAFAIAALASAPLAHAITFTKTDGQSVPNHGTGGSDSDPVISRFVVESDAVICDLNVRVDISHAYTGDLRVTLRKNTLSALLASFDCGSADNLIHTFDDEGRISLNGTDSDDSACRDDGAAHIIPYEPLSVFNDQNLGGTWELEVFDREAEDYGTLNSWQLIVTPCTVVNGPPFIKVDGQPIPAVGVASLAVTSSLMVNADMEICDLDIRVDIGHVYTSDLQAIIRLIRPDGDHSSVILATAVCGDSDNLIETFDDQAEETLTGSACDDGGAHVQPQGSLAVFNRQNVRGTWELEVIDGFQGDDGTLNEWELLVTGCVPTAAPTEAPTSSSAPSNLPSLAPSVSPTSTPVTCLPVSTSVWDAGYSDAFRGWYDVQGCGQANDYCRWVGNSGSGGDPAARTLHDTSWWSCRLAGSPEPYNDNTPRVFNFQKAEFQGQGPQTCGPTCPPPSTDTRDAGYWDAYRGWYDVQGCGRAVDYCRWVGDSGSGGDPAVRTAYLDSWWSCSLAGSEEVYNSDTPSVFLFQKAAFKGQCMD